MTRPVLPRTRGQVLLPASRSLFLLIFLFLSTAAAPAAERITSFTGWIDVHRDGSLTVIETISVIAEGNEIKRGIYRDFPTDYTTPAGNRIKVDFTVLSVQRDGRDEPWFTDRLNNGVRLYIGNKNIFLKPGPYTYTITYQTNRQIGFFDDYDELYWNVTGNDWAFPIDRASATIVLPKGATILQSAWYTGPQGSTAMNAEVAELSGNKITFRTTAPLGIREGLTVAVSWPKGVVHEPTPKEKAASFFRDNILLLVGGIGLLLLILYYLTVWFRVGRDPEPGPIIPRFHPPEGLSPAAGRFIKRMGFDPKGFSAALVSMAVKKALTIRQSSSSFTLVRADGTVPEQEKLSRGEKQVISKLFADSDTVRLQKSNHTVIGAAIKALRKSLRTDFEMVHFKRNRAYMIPGLILTLLIIGVLAMSAKEPAAAIFLSVWLTGWSAGCYALFRSVYYAWKAAMAPDAGVLMKFPALFITFFSLPFLGGWIGGFVALATVTSIPGIGVLISCLLINILFYHLLRAPTLKGRRIMDELEGLRLYLSVAEKDRLNMLNPPEQTPRHFEQLLPWALALDVEQEWCESFSRILDQAGRDGTYTPTWYMGHGHFNPAGLAASLGTSLTGSVASSATAPGSSSGSGGGGSSGGGGGGGGGGGW